MRANGNFGDIQASNGGSGMLPAGGYVVRIAAVEDHTEEEKGYLGIVYDIYDPKTRTFPHHEDVCDPERSWRWTFRYYLTSDFGWSRYKALVEACEKTEENKGFRYVDADGAEQTLVGKWVGFVIRHRKYVPRRGKSAGQEREQLDLAAALPCKQVIAGDFDAQLLETLPLSDADREYLEKQAAPVQAPPTPVPVTALYDEDVPF